MERYHIFRLGLAIIFYAAYCIRPILADANYVENQNSQSESSPPADDFFVYYQGVEGTPGIDFPILSSIPRTAFSCKGIESGYYADLDTDCQVFHICEEEKKISFLCPNGTIFQQSDLICEWWFKVNCTDAPNLYADSAEQLRTDLARRKSLRKVHLDGHERPHGAVLRTEETSSVTAMRSGKKLAVPERNPNELSTKSRQENKQGPNQLINNDEKNRHRLNQEAVSHSKNRRYHDDQTGNYLNNDYQDNKKYSSQKPAVTKSSSSTERYLSIADKTHSLKEYHVQFSATSPGISNEIYNTRTSYTTTSPSQNNLHKNNQVNTQKNHRGDIKFNSHSSEYELDFPKHEKEIKNAPGKILNQNRIQESSAVRNSNKIAKNNVVQKELSNRNSELSGSDETQITQESSSFVKPSYNSIQDNTQKYSTSNPYPNHRTTYSDLQVPNLNTARTTTTISSVTPQYITTQPINNGKPFLGSRVGANIQTSFGTLPVRTNYSSTTQSHIYYSEANTENTITGTANKYSPSDFTGKKSSENSISNLHQGSSVTNKYNSQNNVETIQTENSNHFGSTKPQHFSTTFPSLVHTVSTPQPFVPYSTTARTIDHATVYGSYSRNTPTTPSSHNQDRGIPVAFDKHSDKISIHLTKTVGGNGVGGKTSVKSSVNQNQYVRFVQNEAIPIVDKTSTRAQSGNSAQVHFGKNTNKVNVHLTKSLSNSPSVRPIITIVDTTPLPDKNPKYGNSVQPPLLSLNAFIRTSDLSTPETSKQTITPVEQTNTSGFFVTKKSVPTATSLSPTYHSTGGTTQRPRPFEKYSSLSNVSSNSVTPPYTNYKISSASPFKLQEKSQPIPPQPTSPTVLSSPSTAIYQNLDNMINVLKKLAKQPDTDYSSETPRPGLVIPPSVGPQTLHTLAVYFSNALDGIVGDKEALKEIEEEGITKEKLANLLTQMTLHGYNDLFKEQDEHSESEHTTTATDEGENGLELEGSKNLVQSPHIRELARNFSIALSSYLNDPEMFKKDLEGLRPTEPPSLDEGSHASLKDIEEYSTTGDEELLNFSDADAKSSFPPIYSTGLPSPSPTWGFILATKPTSDLDVKNSLNPDLHTADSQSFIPRFNNLNVDEKNKPSKELPQNHWTTSPSVTKLWKNAFSIHPAVVNNHFDTTPIPPSVESESTESDSIDIDNLSPLPAIVRPHSEINYELRTLPKVTLNSTQIHGILIDFMNTTTPDSERLHRILKKLNTSEDEFLTKMKEIESNPLTKRLILLLISECGENAAKEIESLNSKESLEVASSGLSINRPTLKQEKQTSNSYIPELVNSGLKDDDQDTRALQLLNSLYSIASRFGK